MEVPVAVGGLVRVGKVIRGSSVPSHRKFLIRIEFRSNVIHVWVHRPCGSLGRAFVVIAESI